ncbi:sensor histidine kinase, partial [Listeria innocua FSL S4-378]
SICKKIITLHHGEITVESNTEKGTTFKVKLPKN